MTKEQMEQTVQANMQKIYLYCVRRLGNAAVAEDVASDIILELLRSYPRIKNDKAVYGYIWAVAGNLCRNYWRKAERREIAAHPEHYAGSNLTVPEEDVIRRQDLSLLRRELSLLSEKYREVMVAHYIRNKSCEEIAQHTHMSVTNVKQYLFEGRKKVRDGMDMRREYGVYSYAPEKFTMGFWGDSGSGYWQLFERKLPGSIMLSAFDAPKTIEELSLDVGVAMPYLEEEVAKLEEYRLLIRKGRKYHCGIVIYDQAFREEIYKKARSAFGECLDSVIAAVEKGKMLLKNTDYRRWTDDENARGWFILMLICWEAMQESESKMKTKLTYPLLENGSKGYVFGSRGNISTIGMSGIYGRYPLQRDYIRVLNFDLLSDAFNPFAKGAGNVLCACEAGLDETPELEALSDMLSRKIVHIENGRICTNFSEISEKDYFALKDKLADEIGEISSIDGRVRDMSADTLWRSMPRDIPNVREIGSIVAMFSLLESIVPVILESGYLAKDREGQNPAAFYFRVS